MECFRRGRAIKNWKRKFSKAFRARVQKRDEKFGNPPPAFSDARTRWHLGGSRAAHYVAQHDGDEIEIKDGRHADCRSYQIPGKFHTERFRFTNRPALIITGPNMGANSNDFAAALIQIRQPVFVPRRFRPASDFRPYMDVGASGRFGFRSFDLYGSMTERRRDFAQRDAALACSARRNRARNSSTVSIVLSGR